MRLDDHFGTFLTDTVNLNLTRVKHLESSVEAIKSFVRGSDWKPRLRRFVPQGSWAHKTIIRPLDTRAFDADLLVLVDAVSEWSASDYVDTLFEVFRSDGTYKDKIRRYSHCVTIEYAGERNIDLAPCIIDRAGIGYDVCNRSTNLFEASEPEKFTTWLVERNAWTGSNALRKVTRLIKYLRDIKGTFSCSSVLLTTLLGSRIRSGDADNETEFADVPTSLKTIVNRLDTWLQAYPEEPLVRNPVLPSETFNSGWNADGYSNFRDQIHKYRTWIDDAYGEEDRDESIEKWRRVFGIAFAKGATLQKKSAVEKSINDVNSRNDLVSEVARRGLDALPVGFDNIPHKEKPRWPRPPVLPFAVEIAATRHSDKNGTFVDVVRSSGAEVLPRGHWLRFRVLGQFQYKRPDFQIHWRVANTGEDASRADGLRGQFEKPNDGATRWEHLQYRGVHTVEAFVVRARDGMLVGQSAPFYVVIA